MKWAYGVTAVDQRLPDLLPITLRSLVHGGFPSPRLFVDGPSRENRPRWEAFGMEVTYRTPKIRTFGNWLLALMELYIREPASDRYALFQDDLICSKNLRQYLEKVPYPDKGYLNLYTFPSNQRLAPKTQGFFKAAELNSGPEGFQTGRGAVGLVFSLEAVTTLLRSVHLLERPQDSTRGWKSVDGGVVTSMNKAGWYEYVHNPSLLQHTGQVSSMGSKPQKLAESFRGEEFDCLELLR